MIQILTTPGTICFVEESIIYEIADTASSNPKTLSFSIKYFKEESDYTLTTKALNVRVCAIKNNGRYKVNISDIISTHTRRLSIVHDFITGYAKIKLASIDGSSVTDSEHICLPGISGGISPTAELSSTVHPFILARGNESGSLHLYRSELEAMDFICALCPSAYNDYNIDTDNAEWEELDRSGQLVGIENNSNLAGIILYANHGGQYCIYEDANSLFLHLLPSGANANPLTYTIAINNDPEVDEKHVILWTNSMGAPEALLLTGEMQDASEISDPELYISSQTLQSTIRKQKRRTVTTKYTLHTGYLTPARVIALFDMLSSDEVEMKIDGQWVPVSVTADAKHAVEQREPEDFELTIEVLEQTRYHKPNRTVQPIPAGRSSLLMDNSSNIITDNNSETIY